MLPEVSRYITTARAAGISDEDIHTALTKAGWAEPVITEALAVIPPPPPLPTPAPPPPRTSKPGHRVLIFLIILAVLGGITAAGFFGYHHFLTPPAPSVAITPTPSQQNPTTALYDAHGISFLYPSTWSLSSMQDILGSVTADTAQLFFTPSHREEALLLASPTPVASKAVDIAAKADLVLNRFIKTSARQAAEEATRTICVGEASSFSNTNPVDTTRITSTVFNNILMYVVRPSKDCTLSTLQLFVDGTATIASPSPASSAQISSPYDSFSLTFPNTTLETLSDDQKKILNSISQ